MVVRRTQADRRAATRERLERATVEALVEVGVERTSTSEICRRAELSQGALFQHYPSKQALLVAAVARAYADLRAEFQGALHAGPSDVRTLLVLTWRAFSDPRAVATLELYHRCRTDPPLHAELGPMLDAHAAALLADAAALLGPHSPPDAPVVLGITFAALQGAAPGARIEGREPPLLPLALDWLAARLSPGGAP